MRHVTLRLGGEADIKALVENGSLLEDRRMPVSILHVGVPLDHPVVPVDDREMLRKRLDALQLEMRAAGYDYEILSVSPEDGIEGFKDRLRTRPCDGVLLGGGVVGNPEMSYFMEQIVNATHDAAPHAKIMFHSHAVDVRTTVGRWFPLPGMQP
jgi:hypothetical protein